MVISAIQDADDKTTINESQLRSIGLNSSKRQRTTSLMSTEKQSPFNFIRTEKPQAHVLSKSLFGSNKTSLFHDKAIVISSLFPQT